MVQVKWTHQAVSDLKNISDYISKDSKVYAKRQVSKIKDSTKILKNHIYFGRIVPEFNNENIREIIEGNYRIVYKIVSDKQIDILTIHHSSKNTINL